MLTKNKLANQKIRKITDMKRETNETIVDARQEMQEEPRSYEATIPIQKVLNLLEQHLGPTSEIVYHDLKLPYEHTIVDIRNGSITNRKVGGCGSNLGLEVIRGIKKDGDQFNYITHTKTGRILRSSSIYLYEEGNAVGSICVNTDISDTVRLENILRGYNGYHLEATVPEHFANNVEELLELFMREGQELVGIPAPLMGREEKMKFLKYLDSKGAFLITKSSEQVCEFLGISKYTLYNYLEIVRSEDGASNTRT